MKRTSTALLLAALALAPVASARPVQGPLPSDRVDTYESLNSEYKRAGVKWRSAKRAAKKEDRLDDFDLDHPVLAYFPRFEALAEAGDGEALLWVGLNVGELPRTAGEVAGVKREAFGRVAREFASEPFAKTLADKLDAQDEWLTDEEITALQTTLFETSTRERVRAVAAYKLARRLEGAGDEAGLAAAETWYQRIIAEFPELREARKAEGRLRGLSTAVGRVAPDFESEDTDGNTFRLSDYRGKVVVLDFWGFW